MTGVRNETSTAAALPKGTNQATADPVEFAIKASLSFGIPNLRENGFPDIDVTVVELVPSAKRSNPRIDGSSSALLLVVMILFLSVAYITNPSTPPALDTADIMPPMMRTKNVVAAVPDDVKTFATALIPERKSPVTNPTTSDETTSRYKSQEDVFLAECNDENNDYRNDRKETISIHFQPPKSSILNWFL